MILNYFVAYDKMRELHMLCEDEEMAQRMAVTILKTYTGVQSYTTGRLDYATRRYLMNNIQHSRRSYIDTSKDNFIILSSMRLEDYSLVNFYTRGEKIRYALEHKEAEYLPDENYLPNDL